jgi:hypothetical protein
MVVRVTVTVDGDVIRVALEVPEAAVVEADEETLAHLGSTPILVISGLGEPSTWKVSRGGVTSETQPDGADPVALRAKDAVDRVDAEVSLSAREKAVLAKIIETELTLHQIATALSRESGERVTYSSVKHALARVMGKLRLEPRTRAALVKRVLGSRRR